MTTSVDFHQIRPVDGSRRTGFEKFCGQIARHYCKDQFDKNLQIRDDPDAGLEYFVEVDGDLIGWQAKYFETPPSTQQLSQFKDSFQRAVDNHNRLTKFIACCPFDRASDPSSDSQFLEDRWNDFEEWASEYLEGTTQDVSIEYWGRSELEDFLSEDELRGHQYYWFKKEGLTFRKLNNLAEERIANARIDHSKQSVKLPVERAFELLGRTPKGEQIMADIVNDLQEITFPWEYPIEVGESDVSWDSVPENYRDLAIEEKVQEVVDRLNRSYDIDDEIPITICRESISEIKQKVTNVIEEIPPGKDDVSSDQLKVYSSISKYYRRFLNEINSIANNLYDPIFDLLNQPTLAIWGDAGVGKTHIFCDITKRRLESERPTILYLGEQFRKGNIPSQLVEFTDFDVDNLNELLGALDAMGQVEETRALIQIDGINETTDREIWQQQLRGLIKKIQRYEYVGLSVSYRTEYRDQIEPAGSISDYITYVEHTGFSGYETQAIEVFFNEYGITEPNHPVLRPEFSNPLFLELYCKVLSNKPDRFNDVRVLDISTLFEGYIQSINNRLAAPQRLDYSKYENKVQNAVHSLADLMIKTDQKILPYHEAKTSINNHLPNRTRASEQLFTGLINEDLIEVVPSSSQQDQKKVRFSYERLADHFITQKLIQEHYTGPDSFESGTKLHRQLTTVTGLGKLEINFAIQLPETVGEELTELLPDIHPNSILESYVWRSAETFLNDLGEIKKEILSFIRETSRQYQRETFDTLLKIVGNTDHPLRGEWLHKFLADLSLTQRDLTWSTSMRRWNNDAVQARIISWARTSDAIQSLNEAEKEEYATVLSWIFTSSDRKYRDTATKALVRLLDDDFEATAGLIRRFDDINDPYITHRLYCAAYGQALRYPNKEGITDIAEILFEKEFQNNRPVPDFLAREYARNIVELAIDRHSFSVDNDLLMPPHETEWNGAPSVEDVRKKRNELISRAGNEDEKRAVNSLWGDLVGRDSDSTGYSDFSRYIIGTNHGVEFSNFEYPYEEGCRWILDRVLDFGWDPTLFAEDESRSSYRRNGHLETRKIESFRKKYQWISYWELLGHLSDNHQKTASEDDENNTPINSWEEFLRDIDPSALTANQSQYLTKPVS